MGDLLKAYMSEVMVAVVVVVCELKTSVDVVIVEILVVVVLDTVVVEILVIVVVVDALVVKHTFDIVTRNVTQYGLD